jgi:diphosphomevalonate decarboxylase
MRAIARAQPNIALIKYWGKRDLSRNLPATGSISITLETLYTTMRVELDRQLSADTLTVNDQQAPGMLARVSRCLDSVLGPQRPAARVQSNSNFPIAAGLASSAAAFAALVVAAQAASGKDLPQSRLASLAGQASGSAARSLYGGFVELDNHDDDIRVGCLRAADEWPLEVVVAVTAAGPKPVGSGAAMEISRKTSPFYARWLEQQAQDLAQARQAIADRDFAGLASVTEHNCLKMHSVMWASRPPISYWNSATLDCLQTIRELQADGVAVFFTIDAGPQVKAICPAAEMPRVRDALSGVAGVTDVLVSGIGNGAAVVDND